MKVGLISLALIITACGTTVESDETTTTGADQTTTTTEDTPASTAAATTTTSQSKTTQAVSSQLESFMASVAADGEITSGRMEGSIEITGLDEDEAGVSEATILFSTAFDSTTGDSSFSMDMSSFAAAVEQTDGEDPFADMAASFLGEMEFRQIGDRVYMKFPLFTAMFGAETEWVSMPAEESDEFTGTFEMAPTDPDEILDAYEDANIEVADLGTETVNGVEATHYRISLNTETMDLTAAEQAELEASGLFADGVIPMDIWISQEGYMVRLFMEIDGTGIDAPPEEQFGSMTMRYDMIDINGEIVIEPPPASEVTDIEDLEGSFFGLETEG